MENFIISKNFPLDSFSDMTDLCISIGSQTLSKLRLAKNASYTSWDIVHELLGLLCNTVRSLVTNEMKKSQNFAVKVDKVTDLTTVKPVALCCWYIIKY